MLHAKTPSEISKDGLNKLKPPEDALAVLESPRQVQGVRFDVGLLPGLLSFIDRDAVGYATVSDLARKGVVEKDRVLVGVGESKDRVPPNVAIYTRRGGKYGLPNQDFLLLLPGLKASFGDYILFSVFDGATSCPTSGIDCLSAAKGVVEAVSGKGFHHLDQKQLLRTVFESARNHMLTKNNDASYTREAINNERIIKRHRLQVRDDPIVVPSIGIISNKQLWMIQMGSNMGYIIGSDGGLREISTSAEVDNSHLGKLKLSSFSGGNVIECIDLNPGDTVLVSTDGMSAIKKDEMRGLFQDSRNLRASVRKICSLSHKKTRDDTTAIAIQVPAT
jgi:serine/threonine protein phosphatase PrpC